MPPLRRFEQGLQRNDLVHQVVELEGFGQIVVGALLQPVQHFRLFAQRRQNQNTDGVQLRIFAQASADAVPRLARQHDIEDDQVRLHLLGHLKGAIARMDDGDLVSLRNQFGTNELCEVNVVIDQHDMTHETSFRFAFGPPDG